MINCYDKYKYIDKKIIKHHEAFYYNVLFYYRRRQFILHGRALCCGNDASHRLDKQSLQDAAASLQVRQQKKVTKYKCTFGNRIKLNY